MNDKTKVTLTQKSTEVAPSRSSQHQHTQSPIQQPPVLQLQTLQRRCSSALWSASNPNHHSPFPFLSSSFPFFLSILSLTQMCDDRRTASLFCFSSKHIHTMGHPGRLLLPPHFHSCRSEAPRTPQPFCGTLQPLPYVVL